jgi:hypothetical protein
MMRKSLVAAGAIAVVLVGPAAAANAFTGSATGSAALGAAGSAAAGATTAGGSGSAALGSMATGSAALGAGVGILDTGSSALNNMTGTGVNVIDILLGLQALNAPAE